ncbi:MAG: hypothetical protein JXA42_16585 [Anaerolineales bacterium]|nr:hypothetical protein [Anaerolineales bacterium]
MPENKRQYPGWYEKGIPIILGIIALLPAFGGVFSRMGIGGALYISELMGAVLLFIGFLRAITPMYGKEVD